MLLKECHCKNCQQIFYICRSCWREQAYCCDECRYKAKLLRHRKAQKKYQQTPKGREAHKLAARRSRFHGREKNVDDPSSTPVTSSGNINLREYSVIPRCAKCGEKGTPVTHFPGRGYGKRGCEGISLKFSRKAGIYDRKKTTY